jgi:hypothetical protein
MHLSILGLPDYVQCGGASLLAASFDETGCVTAQLVGSPKIANAR